VLFLNSRALFFPLFLVACVFPPKVSRDFNFFLISRALLLGYNWVHLGGPGTLGELVFPLGIWGRVTKGGFPKLLGFPLGFTSQGLFYGFLGFNSIDWALF